MQRRRFLTSIVLGAGVMGVLAACGGASGQPAAPSGGQALPLFKDAKPVPANDPMASAIDTMKQQIKQSPDADMTVDAYLLPNGATADQVTKFYGDELTKQGWKSAPGGSTASGGAQAAVWLKNDNEMFSVTVMPNPMQSSSPLLVVAHGKKKK
jgi:hypothetical protein